VAVELDRHLAEVLPTSVAAENLQVHNADILEFDPSAPFEADFVVVANLPYHITSPALRHLLGAGPPHARRLLLMVQREVADRVAARVGHLSAIAVFLQAQATIRIARHVPRGAFHPAPKVDSAVLQFEPLTDDVRPVPREDLASFWSFLHAGFAQPRKTLGNSLAQGLAAEKPEAVALIERAGIDPQRRPQQLSVEEWAHLFEVSRQ
jgi:16S rRNA (adenine1518-N6/adenine1519-N6)-dimethyltransferase